MSSVVVAPTRSPALEAVERGGREASRLRTALSSRVYLPACSIAAIAVILLAVGWASDWGGSDFAGSVTSLRVVLVVPLVTGLTLSFVAVARSSLPWIVLPRMGAVPRGAAIAVIFVAMDGCNWFVHLANHRVRMLWRFHELHHSQEDMSVLTVFRTHPLIHVSYLVALIPGVVLLANGVMPTMLLVAYGAMVAFAHSNTRLGFGPLERIFVSPNYHRIHHKLDGPQDVNLGFAFTIWDQLFHRAVFPTEDTIRADTGLPGRPLIVEHGTARARHLS